MPVYTPPFAGTHYVYPWTDGQGELTWVAGYILNWLNHLMTVTNPTRQGTD